MCCRAEKMGPTCRLPLPILHLSAAVLSTVHDHECRGGRRDSTGGGREGEPVGKRQRRMGVVELVAEKLGTGKGLWSVSLTLILTVTVTLTITVPVTDR